MINIRSSSQRSRYVLPILFPIPDSLLEKNGFLLTLSFSSTTHTCLYIDNYLCSQSDILYPFTVGESVLVIGDSNSYSQKAVYSKERANPILQRESLTSGVVVNNLTISQGTLDERTLSRQ